MCQTLHSSAHLPSHSSTHLFICLSIPPSLHLFGHPSIFQSTYPSMYPAHSSNYISTIHPYFHLLIKPSIPLSIHPSICTSTDLSAHSFNYPSAIYPYFHLSLCPFSHMCIHPTPCPYHRSLICQTSPMRLSSHHLSSQPYLHLCISLSILPSLNLLIRLPSYPPIHSTTSLSICFSFIHSPIHLPSIQLFTHPTIHTDLCICIVLLNHPLFHPSIPLSCYSSYLWIFITSIKQRYECSTDILIQCFLIRAAVQSYHEHYLSECEVCATSCTASINVFFFNFLQHLSIRITSGHVEHDGEV